MAKLSEHGRARRSVIAGMLAAAAPAAPGRAAEAQPGVVVVELFQSQGCSSCPPANANLNALADRPDLLALSFSVTYWDQLGWKDTFAKPEYTARQWAYAQGLHRANVATPQVVLNGRSELVGSDRRQLEAAIRAAARPSSLAVSLAAGEVALGAGRAPMSPADVWLVRFDPREQQVAVRRGENGGKTLPHRNIVRQLVRLGGWKGTPASFRLPASPDPAFRTAVLVQTRSGGPILAAAKG